MTIRGYESLPSESETQRSYEITEMHLFDENEVSERALCRVVCPTDNLMGVKYYMEQRLYRNPVGTVCDACKARVVPYARMRGCDLEAEGLLDEAADYRDLADRLIRETSR